MQDIQELLDKNTVIDDSSNVSTGSINTSGIMELKQTNVVKFDQTIESIAVDSKKIKKLLDLCKNAKSSNLPWPEILLGFASLFAGAFLSAIISGVPLDSSIRSILFYIESPVIAVGCGVAFFFMKKIDSMSVDNLAKHILEYLPDIEDEDAQGGNNES